MIEQYEPLAGEEEKRAHAAFDLWRKKDSASRALSSMVYSWANFLAGWEAGHVDAFPDESICKEEPKDD